MNNVLSACQSKRCPAIRLKPAPAGAQHWAEGDGPLDEVAAALAVVGHILWPDHLGVLGGLRGPADPVCLAVDGGDGVRSGLLNLDHLSVITLSVDTCLGRRAV